jgi:DNA invertase Pin-like site-specific DNA recombinase
MPMKSSSHKPVDPAGSFRAAQYVRMSTDHQRYSTENQADAIAAYAAQRNLEIVRTYMKVAAGCVLMVVLR